MVDNPIVQPGVGSPEVTRIDQQIVDPPVAGQSHVAPASTHIPPQQPDETSWQVMLDGREYGPFSTQQMAANITEGRLTPLMMVWRAGMPEWVPAHAQFSFPAAAGNRAAGAALPPIKAPHIALGMAILSLVLSLPLAADRDWLGDGRLLIGVLIAALGGGAIFLVLREFNPQGRSTEDRLRTAAVWVAFAALAVGCLGAR